MNFVDFTEIESSMDWELFAQAFFRSKGFNIIEGPSVGSDGGTGKDLIIEEVKNSEFGEIRRRFLVSCKHYAHREKSESVKESDEKEKIDVNLYLEDCAGFIGFYSTYPTSTLLENLKKLKAKKNQVIEIFDYERIEEYLLLGDKENNLLKIFFTKSYKKWKNLSGKEIEKNQNFKSIFEEDFKIKDKEYFKKYYQGQPADWSIIRKYTFKRDSFDYIIKQLENNKISLLTGAGGEGKTTLLMQVGDYYLKKKYNVFYSADPIQNIEISELKFSSSKKYLLIIDNANTITNLAEFIKKVKLSTGILVLLASRKNEWDYSLSLRKDSIDIVRWIDKPFILHKLSHNEISDLVELLKEHKVLNKDVEDKLPEFLKENRNSNFLLSLMVYATQGKSFEYIIADVISKIQSWESSELTINAIGYIVCLEVLGNSKDGIIYCQETFLKKLLNVTNPNKYLIIKRQLAEEAFFQGSLTNTINTRNPIIAKIYFDYLFYDTSPILDKYTFYYNIIREASYSNKISDKEILATIPKYFFESDKKLAIQLVQDAISYGFFWNTYYRFIDNEISNENIGSYNLEEYSARWLYKKAFQQNSKDPTLFIRWADFELTQSAMGDVKSEYTPRWIFNTGMTLAPFKNLFIIWAKEEIRVKNIGANIDDIYSARWICKQGIDKTPSKDIFVTWANIEANAQNIGKDANDENSARWICKQGIDKKPSADLFVTWANIEANEGNIGRDTNDENSARWICKQGIDKTPSQDIFVTWANIEANAQNIGKDANDENSARWICKEGFEKTKGLHCLYKWLKIELKQNNIGDSNSPYTAQWLFEYYIKERKTNQFTFNNIVIKTASELKEFIENSNSREDIDIDTISEDINK